MATPAFPDNKRTVFKGYLFAGDVLLNESGMQNHPLTPMTDANLVRVMQAQTKRKVGLIDYKTVAQGEGAIRERIAALRSEGVGVADVVLAKADGSVNIDLKGTLPFSWPSSPTQTPLNLGDADYQPQFPYGFGLRYGDKTETALLDETAYNAFSANA